MKTMRKLSVLGTVALTELMAHFLSLGWGLMTLLAAFAWVALSGAAVAAKARSTEDRVNALIPSVGAAHAAAAAAQSTANTASSAASTAQGTANTANSNASSAQSTANSAQSTASSLAGSFHGSFQGNVICPQSRPPNPSATVASLQTSLTDLITALADGGMIS